MIFVAKTGLIMLMDEYRWPFHIFLNNIFFKNIFIFAIFKKNWSTRSAGALPGVNNVFLAGRV